MAKPPAHLDDAATLIDQDRRARVMEGVEPMELVLERALWGSLTCQVLITRRADLLRQPFVLRAGLGLLDLLALRMWQVRPVVCAGPAPPLVGALVSRNVEIVCVRSRLQCAATTVGSWPAVVD